MKTKNTQTKFQKTSDIPKVEQILDYEFLDKNLLQTALTHRSYLNEKTKDENIKNHNERLEFLGDAVLEIVVSDFLYKQMDVNEGQMTKLRSALVKGKINAVIGSKIGLDRHILISHGEIEDFGSARPSIIADTLEAVLGAMYLDSDISAPKKFIQNNILSLLPEIIKNGSYNDHKTILQEYCQKTTRITPKYKVLEQDGKDHNRVYTCGVFIENKLISKAIGRTKQEAETEAARLAYDQIIKKS
jgi:ribonuclease III